MSSRACLLLLFALLAGCRSTARHGDPYALPLPLWEMKDLRPSGDPGIENGSSPEPPPAHERHDVVYAAATASGEPGLLDVFSPEGHADGPRRAVVTLHGGAWRRGDKENVRAFSRRLAGVGFVVFAVNYSLAPKARWPGQLEDLQAALRWIRAHAAELGVDPQHIYAWGASAGGHLATMLALRDDPKAPSEPLHGRVQGAIDAFGDADLSIVGGMAPDEEGILTDFLGAPRAKLSEKQLGDASTVTFARPDAAVLILHGTADFSVSIWHSERLHEALARAGADVSYVRIPEGRHGATTFEAGEAWRATVRFLESR